MALSFPLLLSEFFVPLAKIQTTFFLGSSVAFNETGSGEVIPADFGPRLWQGSITVQANAYKDIDTLQARIELLFQAGASFRVTQSARRGTVLDPNGTILGASTPQITSVAGNNRDVAISGLPASYVLSQGDLVSFSYLSSPTRSALHRVVTTTTANGSGVIAAVELMPPIRPGYATPININLYDPSCKAVVKPGSFAVPSTSRAIVTTMSFDWQQTLR